MKTNRENFFFNDTKALQFNMPEILSWHIFVFMMRESFHTDAYLLSIKCEAKSMNKLNSLP